MSKIEVFTHGSYKDSPTLFEINSLSYGHVPFGGRGKSGKTLNMHGMISFCPDLRSRPKAMFGTPDVSIFPKDYQAYSVDSFDEVIPGSIVILDDVARLFPSRDSKDLTLQRFMGVISHKDILVISTVQSFKNADQCLFRDQVIIPLLKVFSPFGLAFEREEFLLYCRAANSLIPEVTSLLGIDPHLLVFSPLVPEILAIAPPVWYDFRHSHSLRNAVILDSGGKKNVRS